MAPSRCPCHDMPDGDLAPPPTLLGRRFIGSMEGHRLEMTAHYDLHV